MKKILAILLLTLSTSSFAWYHGYRGPVYVNNNNWVAPAIVGAAVGYSLARPYYAPPPVYYTPPPVVYTAPPVTYIQQANPAPAIPPGYHWQYMMDPACDCYKYALVPN